MTYDCIFNEGSEVNGVNSVTENEETNRTRCFHGLFGVKKRRNEFNQLHKIIFYRHRSLSRTIRDARHESFKKQSGSSWVISPPVQRVADTRKHEMCYWSECPFDTEMWGQLKSCSRWIHSWTGQVRQTNNPAWRWIMAWKWVLGFSFSFQHLPSCCIHHMIYCTVSLSMSRENLGFMVSFWSCHTNINKNVTKSGLRTVKFETSRSSSAASDLPALNMLIFVWGNWIKSDYCSICGAVCESRYMICLLCGEKQWLILI